MADIEYPDFIIRGPIADSVYIHLSDINSVDSFFVFMDAAIKCHPFVLLASFSLTLFLFYIVMNSKNIYDTLLIYIHSYNKGGD